MSLSDPIAFLRDLVHELRDPFAAIHGGLQLLPLMESLPDDERQHLFSSLQRNSQALKGVLDDASLYTRLASRASELVTGATADLGQVYRGALEDVRARLQSREQSAPDLSSAESVLVHGDPALLRPLLACLLGALSRGCRHGEALFGEVRIERQQIHLELGGQIHPEDYRLSLAAMLAAASAVQLERTGEQDMARWRVTLRQASSPAEASAAPRWTAGTLATLRTALVVEDNPLARRALAGMLQRFGWSVREAETAEQAREALAAEVPSVIFCDLGLPGDSDGLALARQLRAEPRTARARLMAVTGDTGARRDQALRAGFEAVLEKPLEHRALGELLAGLEGKHDDDGSIHG